MLLKQKVEAQENQLVGNTLKKINAITEGRFQDNWRIAAEVGDIKNIIQSEWLEGESDPPQEANVRAHEITQRLARNLFFGRLNVSNIPSHLVGEKVLLDPPLYARFFIKKIKLFYLGKKKVRNATKDGGELSCWCHVLKGHPQWIPQIKRSIEDLVKILKQYLLHDKA